MIYTLQCIIYSHFTFHCPPNYYRGNQHVKLKLKIPKTVTDRQKQLIEEFDNPSAANTSGTEKTTSSSTDSAKNCNSTFTIEQAWKRVKEYWNSTGKTASGDSKKTAEKESAKEAKASA